MSDSRFSNGHYDDALQYAKDILSNSSSIEEIVSNTNVLKENKEENKDIEE
ncbi:MAG: hypothetical protein ACRC3Y_00235 [Romboutsia sp.]|uniref:hypothetical protein n=1 Tax=Romboutsia sp. TaxID=1965302 RepID=UPI003F3943BF